MDHGLHGTFKAHAHAIKAVKADGTAAESSETAVDTTEVNGTTMYAARDAKVFELLARLIGLPSAPEPEGLPM